MSRLDIRRVWNRLAPAIMSAVLAWQTSSHVGAQQARTPVTAPVVQGQSATQLPDGQWLLVGGEDRRGEIRIWNPASQTSTPIASPSQHVPRAWHTATLLSDGTVLIVGGIDDQGRTISAPERFVPATREVQLLSAAGFAPRARHTATLLTDGRVLIVGGDTPVGSDDAEVWDSKADSAAPLGAKLGTSRAGHSARLLSDGRVLISSPNGQDEAFDPLSSGFYRASRARDVQDLFVTAATPADRARDVELDARMALRFSRPLDVLTVNAASVELSGPEGRVETILVPAESGRLLFVTPAAPLEPSTTYRLDLVGPHAADGASLAAAITFTTIERRREPETREPDDDWTPNTLDKSNGWRTGRSASPWQSLAPLQGPPGATALAGQALTLDGRPLADVTLTIEGQSATTDRTGRFLLLLPGASPGHHELEIEGATASHGARAFGFFEAAIEIESGHTNVLPFTIWMPRLDTLHRVRIPSPTTAEVVLTTPRIPGLEVRIPAGTVIRGHDGAVVRELGITPIPVDRPPFPLPKNVDVPVYFTVQPGGAYLYSTSGRWARARVVYPNYYNVAKGVVANFWNYDPNGTGWKVYGPGLVTGSQVVPDPGVGIYEFTGAMMNTTNTPPGTGRPPGGGPADGDPVDLGTGLFIMEKADLQLPDVIPVAVQRTYRQNDSATRPFGIGSSHPYAMYLWSAQMYQQADLVLPDGGRVHYVRTSSGTGFVNAVFEHTSSPTAFYKSQILWNGNGWDLRLRDGTVYVFGDVAPLQAIRDRFGNTVVIEHSNGQAGNVTRVVSPNGRWFQFTYDGSNRVTQAKDNIGRTVGYQYDGSGRLWKVTDAAGGVTEYTYDTSHRMLTIKDPRGITYLANTYDTNGRVATQTQADSTTYSFSYTLSSGKVTQTDVTDPRGHVRRSTFNTAGYATSLVEAVGLTEERTTT